MGPSGGDAGANGGVAPEDGLKEDPAFLAGIPREEKVSCYPAGTEAEERGHRRRISGRSHAPQGTGAQPRSSCAAHSCRRDSWNQGTIDVTFAPLALMSETKRVCN